MNDNGLEGAIVTFEDGTEIVISQLEKVVFDALRVMITVATVNIEAARQLCSTSKLYQQFCESATFKVTYPSLDGKDPMKITLVGAEEVVEFGRTYKRYLDDLSNIWFPLLPQLLASQAYRLYDRFESTEPEISSEELLQTLFRNGTLFAWNQFGGQAMFDRWAEQAKKLMLTSRIRSALINVVGSPNMEVFLLNFETWSKLVSPADLLLTILKYQRRLNWYEWLAANSALNPLTKYRRADAFYVLPQIKYSVKKLGKRQSSIARKLLRQLMTKEQYAELKSVKAVKPYDVIEPEEHKLAQ